MKTVDDIEEIREELKNIFPDAIRGSKAKTRYGKGRKMLHLCYWIGSDTVGGYMIQARKGLFYFIEWDTNSGYEYKFAESEIDKMVIRVMSMFYGEVYKIERTVRI